MKLGVIVLAAGQGTRMKSGLPKVLHPLGGRPLLRHVVDKALQLDADRIAVVYGHGGETVIDAIAEPSVSWVLQEEQLGTGHAVLQAMDAMAEADLVLVLYGDVPLLSTDTLRHLVSVASAGTIGLLTAEMPDAAGYGRILRDAEGNVFRIVEHKDATVEERRIREINTGIMVAEGRQLHRWLRGLSKDNAQGEYYLTDVIAAAVHEGLIISTVHPVDLWDVAGINDRAQLAEVERVFQQRQVLRLMLDGVTIMDPARFDLRGGLTAGQDVTIDNNVIIEGEVTLGDRVQVSANSVLRNCTIGSGSIVLENCVVEDATVGEGVRIGPFARIRPGTVLDNHTHVGNFVELKNAQLADGAKVNHLSYIGDASIGARANIGAGTITCNYDGADKHRTSIGDDAFIGSNSALVAPVTVGKGATIGAGSTITRDVPDGKLSLSRAEQQTLKGWRRPTKATPKE